MSLTKDDAVQIGLDMLARHSNVKFFEVRVVEAADLDYVAEALRKRGCSVEIDEPALTLRVFAVSSFIGA